ncbi:MAG TPA: type II toxin-antitoxin system VapC family toxin [Candidatus Sulfotelmatobacter sp.]|nr:type II toxin-antitoxin system VapC family toxin [Candidatus Sulfotelmatobacter sp.]
MILIDSNVPMYIVGASHPNKVATLRILEKTIMDRQRLVTDAEVLQEILHRYISIKRSEVIQPAFDALLALVDSVLSVDQETVIEAKQIVLGYPKLSARDALHLAVMRLHGIDRILSFDSGFDGIRGITRIF